MLVFGHHTYVQQQDFLQFFNKILSVVVAQLVEQWFPTPEIRGSNPVIDNFITIDCMGKLIENIKIKKKMSGLTLFQYTNE